MIIFIDQLEETRSFEPFALLARESQFTTCEIFKKSADLDSHRPNGTQAL